jgi:hypothetical protein
LNADRPTESQFIALEEYKDHYLLVGTTGFLFYR